MSERRIAINGIGRIGKLVLRSLLEELPGGRVVLLNDAVGDPAQHAQLLEFDSVHGRWNAAFGHGEGHLTVDGHEMVFTNARSLDALPLADQGIDVVVDCTGVYKTPEKLAPYYEAGVRTVVVSAPVHSDQALNIVYGVNHELYDPARHRLVTAASCTTNCLAPVVKVIHEEIGILRGSMTTIHDVTNTQTIVDRPAKDLRRARSALTSMIPTTTGSAKAITLIYPELSGKLNGIAVRVPILNASLTDCSFELESPTTAEAVNDLFDSYARGKLKGILGLERRALVSADFLNDPRSSIVDGPSTFVVDGTHLRVYAWYDNEWGYACRLADIARMVTERL